MNDKLTDEEKRVMFENGTETPFSGALLHENRAGDYLCKNCGALLFKSDTKFDSDHGWPSFTEPANAASVNLIEDKSHGMVRLDVRCKSCDAHLGHVFEYGSLLKSNTEYCINSVSLEFNASEPKS